MVGSNSGLCQKTIYYSYSKSAIKQILDIKQVTVLLDKNFFAY